MLIPIITPLLQGALQYLLRAPFDADNQGYDDAQVLNTIAEGVQKGQLTVVEVDGTLAIVSNECAFTAQVTAVWGDLGFFGEVLGGGGYTRSLGFAVKTAVNLNVTDKRIKVPMWNDAAGIVDAADYIYQYHMADTGILHGIVYNGAGGIIEAPGLCNYSAMTDYELAIVLGGYDNNGVPWRTGQAATSYLYGASFFIRGGAFTDWTLLWRSASMNTVTLYPCMSNDKQVGTIDDFRVPDRSYQVVLQPSNLSLYGSAGELSAYTPDVGGGWTEDIGDWDTSGGTLTATVLGIGTFTGLADCVYDTEITMPGAGTTAGGLVLRGADYTGASEDYWYVKCTPATAGNDFELIEYAAGAATQRAVTDVDFTGSTAYDIRAICDGTTIDCFADGGDKISYASAASGQTATDFGLRDEGNGNMTFDKTALYPRTGYGALNRG